MILNGADTSPEPKVYELRGFLLALLIIPVGIVAWGIVWKLGVIAAIIAIGIAFGAFFLYRLGAGGKVTVLGVVLISVITLVTVFLAFVVGLMLDFIEGYSAATGESQVELFFRPEMWDLLFAVLKEPGVMGELMRDILLTAAFTVVGIALMIRAAFAKAPAAVTDAEALAAADAAPGQPTDASIAPSAAVDAQDATESDAPRA